MSFVASILTVLINYLTSLWSVARMVFGVLPTEHMKDVFGLLSVIFLIYIVDSLPIMINRGRKNQPVKLPQFQLKDMKPIIVWVKDE